MTWFDFKEQIPLLGQNILVKDSEGRIGVIKFDKEIKKCMEDETYGHRWPSFVDLYNSDVNNCDDNLYQTAVENCTHWMFLYHLNAGLP